MSTENNGQENTRALEKENSEKYWSIKQKLGVLKLELFSTGFFTSVWASSSFVLAKHIEKRYQMPDYLMDTILKLPQYLIDLFNQFLKVATDKSLNIKDIHIVPDNVFQLIHSLTMYASIPLVYLVIKTLYEFLNKKEELKKHETK